ncbi:hypothetical protein C2845_PM12G17060 [Panicum miliaceum]|uniref:Uncharacterized protein n=1 Tax=Panicum miliaceum TaxID=4540 RepID=A0A3L6QLU3_PANMI|nr:hypothetical protein C2845_PM12G17060 [Panicum miliaceum]
MQPAPVPARHRSASCSPAAACSCRRHDLRCGHDLPPLPRRREAGSPPLGLL